jgi:hypothetical protein
MSRDSRRRIKNSSPNVHHPSQAASTTYLIKRKTLVLLKAENLSTQVAITRKSSDLIAGECPVSQKATFESTPTDTDVRRRLCQSNLPAPICLCRHPEAPGAAGSVLTAS